MTNFLLCVDLRTAEKNFVNLIISKDVLHWTRLQTPYTTISTLDMHWSLIMCQRLTIQNKRNNKKALMWCTFCTFTIWFDNIIRMFSAWRIPRIESSTITIKLTMFYTNIMQAVTNCAFQLGFMRTLIFGHIHANSCLIKT